MYRSLSMLLCTCSSVLAFCESFITVIIERLMRKCWQHISLFTMTSHLAQWFVNWLCSFSLKVVHGRQSDFVLFPAGEGAQHPPQTLPLLLNILAFFSETHSKQSLCDVSLQMYYCASSVCGLGYLDVSVLAGLGAFPVKSDEMAMKRTGS